MERLIELIEQLKIRCIKNESIIMEGTSLSPAEYNGISALDLDERISGSDLSRKMKLSPSRASRVVDKLVRNGFLTRECDAEDRRRCTISLAKKGARVKRKIEEIKNDCEKKIVRDLTDREITDFTNTLKKINNIL